MRLLMIREKNPDGRRQSWTIEVVAEFKAAWKTVVDKIAVYYPKSWWEGVE